MIKKHVFPFLVVMLLMWTTAVFAHSEILASAPAPGEMLAESPSEIRLTFNESVAPTSSLLLFSGGFQQVEGIEMANEPENPNQIVAKLPELSTASYTVEWTALSPDGHTVRGSYSFSVAEASHDSLSLWWFLLVLGLVLLFAGSAWWRWRARLG